MAITLKDVGDRVRAARKSQGLTQIELSKKCGLCIQAIRVIEQGNTCISIKNLIKISEALGKRLVIFFDEI